MNRPAGIAGLEGKEPVGAVLTVGTRAGPKAPPSETDRFYIKVPMSADGVRIPCPGFEAFNVAPPEKRQAIQGYLVHEKPEQMFEYHLKAQQLPKLPMHPGKAPSCVGNGVDAQRWDGKEFRPIKCPNDLCEFRQAQATGATPCKPFFRFLFRPKWKDGSPLPTPLMKLTSQSWNSVRAWIGFFDYLKQQAATMEIENPSFYGMPFQIVLSRKTSPKQQRSFPVLSISTEGDVQAFFYAQRMKRKEMRELEPAQPVMMLTDKTEQSYEVLAADGEMFTTGIPREQT